MKVKLAWFGSRLESCLRLHVFRMSKLPVIFSGVTKLIRKKFGDRWGRGRCFGVATFVSILIFSSWVNEWTLTLLERTVHNCTSQEVARIKYVGTDS